MNRRDRRQKPPRPQAGAFRPGSPDDHAAGAIPPVVAELRAHPGEWRIVEEGAPKALLHIGQNAGWLRAHPAGFETKEMDGIPGNPASSILPIVTLYARWVGPNGEHATPPAAAGGLPADAPRQIAAALGVDASRVRWDQALDVVALVRSWGATPPARDENA